MAFLSTADQIQGHTFYTRMYIHTFLPFTIRRKKKGREFAV